MTLPSLETIFSYLSIAAAVGAALLAALWLSLIIWSFRDMRMRTRDPFAQLLATLVVAALPGIGLLIYLILRPPETLAEAYERALEEEALLQEIEERPACPGCSRVADPAWILCPYCHTRLRKRCLDCDSLLELQWNLCPFCGNQHVDPYRATSPSLLTEMEDGESVDSDEHVNFDEHADAVDSVAVPEPANGDGSGETVQPLEEEPGES